MSRETGGVVGIFQPDDLIAKVYPPCDVFILELAKAGEHTRGTVLSREEDGTYAVLGAGNGTASAILAEDTDETDTTAEAYRSGHFYRNKLTVAEGYELTDADENNLRLAGILLSDGV
jgi:hypothetical protein